MSFKNSLMKSRWIGRRKSLNGRLEFSERVFRRMKKKTYAIVNTSFHNAKFSDRIWMYQDMMNAELSKLLQQGLIRGKHPRDLARHLKKLFGVNQYNTERLMITELARVQSEAQKQSFERNGFEYYEYIACGKGMCAMYARFWMENILRLKI